MCFPKGARIHFGTSSLSPAMTTPAFSFAAAQKAIKNEWYAPLISADFAPQTTIITFPDGYQSSFADQISIPSVSHQIA